MPTNDPGLRRIHDGLETRVERHVSGYRFNFFKTVGSQNCHSNAIQFFFTQVVTFSLPEVPYSTPHASCVKSIGQESDPARNPANTLRTTPPRTPLSMKSVMSYSFPD